MKRQNIYVCIAVLLAVSGTNEAQASVKIFPPDGVCQPGTILSWQGPEQNVKCVNVLELLDGLCPPGCVKSISSAGAFLCRAPAPRCLRTETRTNVSDANITCGRFTGSDGLSLLTDACLPTTAARGTSGVSSGTSFYGYGTTTQGAFDVHSESETEVCVEYEPVTVTCPNLATF